MSPVSPDKFFERVDAEICYKPFGWRYAALSKIVVVQYHLMSGIGRGIDDSQDHGTTEDV